MSKWHRFLWYWGLKRAPWDTLASPGPPAHWPGCEKEGCNCWTCGRWYERIK